MDIQAIYDYARTSLDSDDTELPDTLLGVWVNEAEARIFAAIKTSQRIYGAKVTVTGTGLTQAFATTGVEEPRAVSGPTYQLEPIPHEIGLRTWPLNRTDGSPAVVGNPSRWSVDDDTGKLWLWPAPTSGQTFIVTGLHVPSLTVVATKTNVPDMPVKYHPLLAEFAVVRGHELQQNAQMASMKLSRFEGELDVLAREDTRVAKDHVVTIGGATSRWPTTPLARQPWPWE